jgi:hypothetical protein
MVDGGGFTERGVSNINVSNHIGDINTSNITKITVGSEDIIIVWFKGTISADEMKKTKKVFKSLFPNNRVCYCNSDNISISVIQQQ